MVYALVFEFLHAGVLPKYFSSEWSFARFHIPECTQFIAAFGSQNTLVIVGMDGRYEVINKIIVISCYVKEIS